MKTEQMYLEDAYKKTLSAKVIEIARVDQQTVVTLDKTIFYAQGGGQPADQGSVVGPQGTLTVSHVSYSDGMIQHKGKLDGSMQPGENVELTIDWALRYQHMQMHTAGHVLDLAVRNLLPTVQGVDGDHGIGKRCFIAFDTAITDENLPAIEQEIRRLCAADLPITSRMTTKKAIEEEGISLPFALPENKDLRLVQIGSYMPMPDGGTHLSSTKELWPINLTRIQEKDGLWRVEYQVVNPELQEMKTPVVTPSLSSAEASLPHFRANLASLLSSAQRDISQSSPSEELRARYLGKNGLLNQVAASLRTLSNDDKKIAGQEFNSCKTQIEQLFTTQTQTAWSDPTLPAEDRFVGHLHPMSQAIRDITRIFERIGFTRVRYPEVDWDHYAFEALNMPKDHPARDEWETFFVDTPVNDKWGKTVLTPHTSNGQVREMERLGKPPIRMINIGRCYRRQQDVTHTQMFHQFEGLVVDKGITVGHLKGTFDYFVHEFFGPGKITRLRPFHFQFTEPSFEVDMTCVLCDGTGLIDGEKCRFCKSGWHELGGAGMVHPNVLRAGGIDPDEYTGFAFGWGIERTYTLQKGLQLDDIRPLYNGDFRFLQQF